MSATGSKVGVKSAAYNADDDILNHLPDINVGAYDGGMHTTASDTTGTPMHADSPKLEEPEPKPVPKRIMKRWTSAEHDKLQQLVTDFGTERNWTHVASHLEGRTGKQCRERWLNHLRPNIKKGSWTTEEEHALVAAHCQMDNHWSRIAKRIPGRTENAIKNFWNATWRSKTLGQRRGLLHQYINLLKQGLDRQQSFDTAHQQLALLACEEASNGAGDNQDSPRSSPGAEDSEHGILLSTAGKAASLKPETSDTSCAPSSPVSQPPRSGTQGRSSPMSTSGSPAPAQPLQPMQPQESLRKQVLSQQLAESHKAPSPARRKLALAQSEGRRAGAQQQHQHQQEHQPYAPPAYMSAQQQDPEQKPLVFVKEEHVILPFGVPAVDNAAASSCDNTSGRMLPPVTTEWNGGRIRMIAEHGGGSRSPALPTASQQPQSPSHSACDALLCLSTRSSKHQCYSPQLGAQPSYRQPSISRMGGGGAAGTVTVGAADKLGGATAAAGAQLSNADATGTAAGSGGYAHRISGYGPAAAAPLTYNSVLRQMGDARPSGFAASGLGASLSALGKPPQPIGHVSMSTAAPASSAPTSAAAVASMTHPPITMFSCSGIPGDVGGPLGATAATSGYDTMPAALLSLGCNEIIPAMPHHHHHSSLLTTPALPRTAAAASAATAVTTAAAAAPAAAAAAASGRAAPVGAPRGLRPARGSSISGDLMDPDFMQMVFDGIMSFEDHALDLLDYSKCPALPVSSSTGHTGPQDHAVDLQAQAGTYTTSAVAAPAASNALAASSYVATAGAPFPDLLATLSSIYAGTAVTSGGPDAATSQPVLLAPTAGCSFEYPAVANHAAAAGIRPAAGLGEVHSMMYATSQPAASLAPPPQQQQQQHASALGLPFSSQLLYADAVAFATCTPTTATQQLNSNGKRARSCECSLAEAAALLLSPHYQGGNCMLGFADARHPRQHEVPGQQDGSYELPSHALREWGTEVNPSCGGGGDALLASLIGPEQWETGTGHKLQLQQQPEQQPTELLQQVQHQMGSIFDGALKASLTARESNEWDQLFQLQSNC